MLEEINAFCRARHGRLRELADFLGVKPPSVSRYLSGASTPSPDKLELMQKWMAGEIQRETDHAQELRSRINGLRRTNELS
jgi:transcriptional regulator with XRE-family HTH domain